MGEEEQGGGGWHDNLQQAGDLVAMVTNGDDCITGKSQRSAAEGIHAVPLTVMEICRGQGWEKRRFNSSSFTMSWQGRRNTVGLSLLTGSLEFSRLRGSAFRERHKLWYINGAVQLHCLTCGEIHDSLWPWSVWIQFRLLDRMHPCHTSPSLQMLKFMPSILNLTRSFVS